MPRTTLPRLTRSEIRALRDMGISFVRIFGSWLKSPHTARDVDLVVGPGVLRLEDLSRLVSMMEKRFGREIDVVSLKPGLNPTLVREIAAHSVPFYEAPAQGRADYAVLIDRFLAIAEDELLAFPMQERKLALRKAIKKLRVP